MSALEKRRTFVLRPEADSIYTCCRCRRKLRAGVRVTVIRESRDLVRVRHAGRWCPIVPGVSRR